MSKACLSLEEAEQTQAHYKKVYNVDSLVQVGTGSDEYRYFVFRAADGKILKCVNYSPADLEPIIAEAAAVWEPQLSQQNSNNNDDEDSDQDNSDEDSDDQDNGGQDNSGQDGVVKAKCQLAATESAGGTQMIVFPTPPSLELVASFHRFFGAPVVDKPSIPPLARTNLRIALISEETKELQQAVAVQSVVDIADALCDIQYVLSGTVLEFGFGSTFDSVFADYTADSEFMTAVLIQAK